MTKKTKNAPHINQVDPTVVSEIFTRRVAVLAMGGMTSKKIAEEMGLSKDAIEGIQKGDIYKSYLKHVGEQDMNVEVMRMKHRLSGMAEKAAKVYDKVMDDYLEGKSNARDAVTVAQSISRAIGADKDESVKQDANLTIILPGGKETITFDAETGDETV